MTSRHHQTYKEAAIRIRDWISNLPNVEELDARTILAFYFLAHLLESKAFIYANLPSSLVLSDLKETSTKDALQWIASLKSGYQPNSAESLIVLQSPYFATGLKTRWNALGISSRMSELASSILSKLNHERQDHEHQ